MKTQLIPVEDRLGFIITRTSWAIRGHMNAKLHSLGVDLTPEQWMALNWLFHHPQACQQDLALAMHKNKANITRILDGLCAKGYVARVTDGDDRRRFRLQLSNDAQAMMQRILPPMLKEYANLLAGLNDSQIQIAKDLLNHIFNKLQGTYDEI